MNIAITGSSGLVGKYLFKSFRKDHSVSGISRKESSTTTHRGNIALGVKDILDVIKPDVIIHTAALTAVDYCEDHPEEAMDTNARGTKNLVEWAQKHRKKIIYISTDYVYPGETNNYCEESETRPINVYGTTKLFGENLVKTLPNYLILRPTVIFGWDPGGYNFLMQMLSLKEKPQRKKIPFDQISNPTDVRILCEYIKRSLVQDLQGAYIATGPTSIDRFSFAEKIASHYDIDCSLLEKTATCDLHQRAKRPLNNGTDSSRIRKALGYDCPNLEDSLLCMKRDDIYNFV